MANATNVIEVLAEIKESGLLEDRREYEAFDLEKMYGLSPEDAADLYGLIQGEFEPKRVAAIHEIPANTIKEYLEESQHGSWEGFRDAHKVALELLVIDLCKYAYHTK